MMKVLLAIVAMVLLLSVGCSKDYDSDYRLEKNEVTGMYRIVERGDARRWYKARPWYERYVTGPKTEKEWIDKLESLRAKEQEQKSWRVFK